MRVSEFPPFRPHRLLRSAHLQTVLGATFMAEGVLCRLVLSRRVQLNKRREVDIAESLFPILLLLVIHYDGNNRGVYMFLMAAFLSMDARLSV